MKTVVEKERSLNVASFCDVAVAGGGIAGIAAALAAARHGAKTLLIEKSWLLGGLATSGLVTIYLPLCDGRGRQLSFGIAEELLRLSISLGCEDRYPAAWLDGEGDRTKERFLTQFNAQVFAILCEQLLIKEGVEILYGASVCAVRTENGAITHLVTESKSGREAVKIKCAVDCTGDADVCRLAGEKTAAYARGNVLASWYYFSGPDGYKLKMLGAAESVDKGAKEKEKPHYAALDARELSEMTVLSHKTLLDDFKKDGGVRKDHALATVATIPQVRMTRRLSGAFTMDEADAHKSFADSVGMFGDWRKRGPAFELPFGTLHGEMIKNLAAAGRCISVTDALWDVTRVIPVCAVSGQAAGTAAATFSDFTRADIPALQSALEKDGVKLKL
ncbi:MAG: FAD-dependent oxidoreductase [Clostridia bacterium]|nr:FAD-dependent oxidoreductase [Clostridia bacterium]